jgi:hypothetical protein
MILPLFVGLLPDLHMYMSTKNYFYTGTELTQPLDQRQSYYLVVLFHCNAINLVTSQTVYDTKMAYEERRLKWRQAARERHVKETPEQTALWREKDQL